MSRWRRSRIPPRLRIIPTRARSRSPPIPSPRPDAGTRMSTILLADDSPHAQRMGERILREEGFGVSSVADEATALARLADGDPDLVIVDAFLPGSGGLDLCRYIKKFHRHVPVILTAGQLEVL